MLTGVDLEVEAGEIVAVCGATGSGKTSLLNLAARFYDPTAGRVLLGGTDLRDLRLEDVRSAVSVVTQRPILFSIPLRDNLMIGRPDAGWDEVLAASEAAGVAAFVDDLPDGYDTLIGERGVNLSGGQRQRVALARALLAGSRRDRDGRPAVGGGHRDRARSCCAPSRPALRGRTVLVATQRLSTVALADRAVVLRDGRSSSRARRRSWPRCGGDFTALFGDETRCGIAHRSGLSPPDRLPAGPAAGGVRCWCWSRPARRSAQTGGWLLVRAAIDNGIGASTAST